MWFREDSDFNAEGERCRRRKRGLKDMIFCSWDLVRGFMNLIWSMGGGSWGCDYDQE